MTQEILFKIIQHIFSNWTGLKLAVEHSMGGPNSKQVAIDCVRDVTQFCIEESNLEKESLEDFLEDVMDEKFDTLFEDESPKEISAIILHFVNLLKNGYVQQCEEEFQKLPTVNVNWLQESKITNHNQQVNIDSSSDEEEQQTSEVPMEDDGWTLVQTKKKR